MKKPFLSPLGRVLAVGRSIYPLTLKTPNLAVSGLVRLNPWTSPKSIPSGNLSPEGIFTLYLSWSSFFSRCRISQNHPNTYYLGHIPSFVCTLMEWYCAKTGIVRYSNLRKPPKYLLFRANWHFKKSLLHPECRRAASIPSTGKAICHHCLVPADGGRPAVPTSQMLVPPWGVTLHNLCLVLLSHASLTSPGIGDDLIDVLLLPSMLIATCRLLFRSIFYLPASAHCLSPLHDLTSLHFFWAMSPLFFRCKFSTSDIWQVPLCSIRITRRYFHRKFPAAFRISFFTAIA